MLTLKCVFGHRVGMALCSLRERAIRAMGLGPSLNSRGADGPVPWGSVIWNGDTFLRVGRRIKGVQRVGGVVGTLELLFSPQRGQDRRYLKCIAKDECYPYERWARFSGSHSAKSSRFNSSVKMAASLSSPLPPLHYYFSWSREF